MRAQRDEHVKTGPGWKPCERCALKNVQRENETWQMRLTVEAVLLLLVTGWKSVKWFCNDAIDRKDHKFNKYRFEKDKLEDKGLHGEDNKMRSDED